MNIKMLQSDRDLNHSRRISKKLKENLWNNMAAIIQPKFQSSVYSNTINIGKTNKYSSSKNYE